jgi:alpha-L-rhamnosidase
MTFRRVCLAILGAWVLGAWVAVATSSSPPSTSFSYLPLRPYPFLNNKVRETPLPGSENSPDPLVNAIWPNGTRQDEFQAYVLYPKTVHTDTADSFDGLERLVDGVGDAEVLGPGLLRVDFGCELAGWLEIVSDDMPAQVYANLTLSLSEDSVQYPGKILQPKKYTGGVYRIETNPYIYEGIRFGFIHVYGVADHEKWHIKSIRAVAQTLPVPYRGSFNVPGDSELSTIWYSAAYCPKLNMATHPLPGMVSPSKFMLNAILMDRGDRIGWTGDDHIAQRAIMKAFGQYEFVRQNLWNTHNNSNAIATYSLYWVLSVFDYFKETGDQDTLVSYLSNIETKLDRALQSEGSSIAWGMRGKKWASPPQLAFVGWDERLGCGFENASCVESQRVYSMLSLRTSQSFVEALKLLRPQSLRYSKLIQKYSQAASKIVDNVRQQLGREWFEYFQLHSVSEALNSPDFTTAEERAAIYNLHFLNQTAQICSFSSFNQFFVLTAIGSIEGKARDAIEIARLCWGGQNRIGGTTYFETFSPSWLDVFSPNDRLPAFNNGRTSLCHPWASGVLTWLTENVLGVTPSSPGYRVWQFLPRRVQKIQGTVPTPCVGGDIEISFNGFDDINITVPVDTQAIVYLPFLVANDNKETPCEGTKLHLSINGEDTKQFTLLSKEQGTCHALLDQLLVGGKYRMRLTFGSNPIVRSTPPLPPPYYDATYMGFDVETNGTNWRDRYGTEGYLLFSPLKTGEDIVQLPDYISNYSTKIWENRYPQGTFIGSKNASSCALKLPNQRGYGLGTILNYDHKNFLNSYIDILFDESISIQSRSHRPQISLYMCDWPAPTLTIDSAWERKVGVVAFDRITMNTVSPISIVEGFQGGVWMTWKYTKSIRFRIVAIEGNGPTLSAVAFD